MLTWANGTAVIPGSDRVVAFRFGAIPQLTKHHAGLKETPLDWFVMKSSLVNKCTQRALSFRSAQHQFHS